MIILLSPPRRAWLMSFWLALSLGSGLLIGLVVALFISPRWFGLGVLLMPVLAFPGLLWPQAIARPYRVWNSLARTFGRVAHLWLMGICFYIVLVAVGRQGSSLCLARPTSTTSLWVRRETLALGAYVSQYSAATATAPGKGWMATFLAWAAQSGNIWAWSLLPFFILLAALRTNQKQSNFPDIYTLF
jgi:hypothetical protein